MNKIYFLLPFLLFYLGCQTLNGTIQVSEHEQNTTAFNYLAYPQHPELLRLNGAEAQLVNKDFSGLDLVLYVNIENPNNFHIRFPEINWNYSIDGVQVAQGNFTEAAVVSASSVETKRINVNIAYNDIFQLIDRARDAVEANGIFSFDIGTNDYTELTWPIDILHEPEITFQGIRRQSLGRTMVFVFTWEVNNRNTFDLEIREFDYNIRINNRLWSADKAVNLPRVRANSRTALPITVSVSEASIIAELVDILNQGAAVNYNNSGTLSFFFDSPDLVELDKTINFQGSTRIR